MSEPLVATGRFRIPYVVSTKTHVSHFYCRNIQAVGGTYNINSRSLDANDIVWTDAAERAAVSIAAIMATSVVFGTVLLEKLVSGVWLPQATYTALTGVTGGTYRPCTQVTVVLRDTAFKKIKVVIMESIEVEPQHSTSATAGDAAMDAALQGYLSTHSNANDPYVWMVGRGNRYLNTNPFVSFTIAYNRKTRRARGFA